MRFRELASKQETDRSNEGYLYVEWEWNGPVPPRMQCIRTPGTRTNPRGLTPVGAGTDRPIRTYVTVCGPILEHGIASEGDDNYRGYILDLPVEGC